MTRRTAAAVLVVLLLAGCSREEIRGTAGRTARNVCANASNCTVYKDGEPVPTGTLDRWDTKR